MAPLNKFENGSVVVELRVDSGDGWFAACERRHNDYRYAETQQRPAVYEVSIHVVGGDHPRRLHGIEKAARLIAIHNQHCVLPAWAAGDCLVDLVEEGLARPHVCVGMVVVAIAIVEEGELGIEEGDSREIAGGCVVQEIREKGRYADVFVSPKGENWYVREVVLIANARGHEAVPDGRQSGHVASVGEPVSLCGMLEDAIRRGGTENRGEIVIEGREVARQCAEEGQVFLNVVADREAVVGGGAQPPVHLAIAVLASATGVGVIRVGVG